MLRHAIPQEAIRVGYLAWWGAVDGGGETIGDLYALRRVAGLAARCCERVVILSRVAYVELRGIAEVRSDWHTLVPSTEDALVFVCGPIIQGSASLRALIARFSACRTFGIGVSVLPPRSADAWQPFERLVARDGVAGAVGDLAFSSRASRYAPAGPLGICLRGPQREYGAGSSLDARAAALAQLAIDISDRPHLQLDTRLHGDADAAERIVAAFSSCSVVFSTRLHGCLLALSLGIPVIAIDQIDGGAKVLAETARLGWQAAWGADDPGAPHFLSSWPWELERLRRAVPVAQGIASAGLADAERSILAALSGERGGDKE